MQYSLAHRWQGFRSLRCTFATGDGKRCTHTRHSSGSATDGGQRWAECRSCTGIPMTLSPAVMMSRTLCDMLSGGPIPPGKTCPCTYTEVLPTPGFSLPRAPPQVQEVIVQSEFRTVLSGKNKRSSRLDTCRVELAALHHIWERR